MVSLRGRELQLLGLRGRLAVGGRLCTEVTLIPGLEVELAKGLGLTVIEVDLPEEALALEGQGLARQVLTGVSSLLVEPRLRLVAGYHHQAKARIWSNGDGWRVERDGVVDPLRSGDVLDVGGHSVRALSVPLAAAAMPRTEFDALRCPLSMIANYDTVHIHQEDRPVLVLSGRAAHLISELVSVDGPISWEPLAREVWGHKPTRAALRRSLDVTLGRLRKKLRDARIRTDLIRPDGTGRLELVMLPGDTIEDRT